MMLRLTICTLVLISGIVASAQKDLKIAHLNYSELILLMPETDSIRNVLQDEEKEMEEKLLAMEKELNKTVLEYEKAEKDTNNYLMKLLKEQALEINSRMESFRNTAFEKLQNRSIELMTPLYDKIENAVNKVVKEHNIAYVLDSGSGSVIYTGEDSFDLMYLFKKELGL